MNSHQSTKVSAEAADAIEKELDELLSLSDEDLAKTHSCVHLAERLNIPHYEEARKVIKETRTHFIAKELGDKTSSITQSDIVTAFFVDDVAKQLKEYVGAVRRRWLNHLKSVIQKIRTS